MKKQKKQTPRAVKFFAVWVLTVFLILCFCVALIPPNDENKIELAGAPTAILLIVPILVGWISVRGRNLHRPKNNLPTPYASVGTSAWIHCFGWSSNRVVDGLYKGQGILKFFGVVCITLPMFQRVQLDRSTVRNFSILCRNPNTSSVFTRSGKYQMKILYRSGGASIIEVNWNLCEALINILNESEIRPSTSTVPQNLVSDTGKKEVEIASVVEEVKPAFRTTVIPKIVRESLPSTGDKMLDSAIEIIVETKQASPSMLQRKLTIGYEQAARIINELEHFGIVGPFQGASPREVLVTRNQCAGLIKELREKKVLDREVHMLLVTIKIDTEAINKTETVTEFVRYYDEIENSLRKLISMGVTPPEMSELPSMALDRLMEEFQWHLCDAIERSKDHSIQEIRSKYRNSVEFQKKEALNFAHRISLIQGRCSPDTIEFSENAVNEVFKAAKLDPPNSMPVEKSRFLSVEEELQRVDSMEGHGFEHWCAELLRKNGFTNVEVTKGSGDQGVDVLAVKDGIRYAFQCKCYSSDLGNKPVQEVHAGKAMYRCQVGVVITNRHFTAGARELAEATGVLLWDRDRIISLLEGLSPDTLPLSVQN